MDAIPNSCVVLLSGGMDSSTLLFRATHEFAQVQALTLIYAQRHQREVQSAKEVAQAAGVPHRVIDVSNISPLLQGSALTSEVAVPKGHYAEENMKLTVVPNRNMILLSLAIGYAVSQSYEKVAYAAHIGDHAIYPDCRPEFIEAMNRAAHLCHFYPVSIYTPFSTLTKGDIVAVGLKFAVPFAQTWTCYDPILKDGFFHACGECGSCTERILAFHENNEVDPVLYIKPWSELVERATKLEKEYQESKDGANT